MTGSAGRKYRGQLRNLLSALPGIVGVILGAMASLLGPTTVLGLREKQFKEECRKFEYSDDECQQAWEGKIKLDFQ